MQLCVWMLCECEYGYCRENDITKGGGGRVVACINLCGFVDESIKVLMNARSKLIRR